MVELGEKTIETIKKLLVLSRDQNSLNESIAAAAKAKELMQRYNLSVELVGETGASTKLRGKIIDSVRDQKRALNKVAVEDWHAALANVLCNHNHCRCYLTYAETEDDSDANEVISVIGQLHDVEFIFQLYPWLEFEIARLSVQSDKKESLEWYRDFKYGAIAKIATRLSESKEFAEKEFRRTAKTENGSIDNVICILDSRIGAIDSYLKSLNLKSDVEGATIKENFGAYACGYTKANMVDLLLNKKINK